MIMNLKGLDSISSVVLELKKRQSTKMYFVFSDIKKKKNSCLAIEDETPDLVAA